MEAENNSNLYDSNVIIVTTNDLPGHKVVEVFGEVFGVITRSRNIVSNIGAGLKTIVGGEIGAYTKLTEENRYEALRRLRDEAAKKGANAVLMARFDTETISDIVAGVVAYGTAVRVEKL
jgi:uncharacterized protein YbjQ (UPF0145 family)